MDSNRFDQLTRALATDMSRRSVLGTLLAAAGALLFPRSGRAACIKPGQTCKQGDECCAGHICFEAICDCPSGIFDDQGNCAPRGASCTASGGACKQDDECCSGYTCFEGLCDCPSGYFDKQGNCAPPPPCAKSGEDCAGNEECCDGAPCFQGACGCPPGYTVGNGTCTPPPDPNSESKPTSVAEPEPTCIAAGGPCANGDACCDGYTCFEGRCDCPSGLFDADGRCAPPGSVETICLVEGSPCAENADCCIDDGLTCQEGVCLPAITVQVGCSDVGDPCGTGQVCCGAPATTCSPDGVCTCAEPLVLDRTGLTCVAICSYPDEPCTDDSPCCEGAGTCLNGVCRCPDALRPCGATCIDPKEKYRRDAKNCGARGNACKKGEICCEGVCVAEAALATDPDHCGGCCTACHPWEICCDGTCDQPFVNLLGDNVCCEPENVCAPGDGTEICCLAGEACHNGGCCQLDKVCGETCCDSVSTCQCGVCVEELNICEDDGDCCGLLCVDGVCCPEIGICPGETGGEICCGAGHQCGPVDGTCMSIDPARAIYPIRTPTRGG